MRPEVIIQAWCALATLLEPQPTWEIEARMAPTACPISDGGWWKRAYHNQVLGGEVVETSVVAPRQRAFETLADALIPHRVFFDSRDTRIYAADECSWRVHATYANPKPITHRDATVKHPILADAAAVAAARVLGLIPEEAQP